MILPRRQGVIAFVPVKRLGLAKSRLAPLLTPSERAALVGAMLGDVLDVLLQVRGLDAVLVVTNDPAVAALSRDLGVETDPDPAERGINVAVLGGLRRFAAKGWRRGLIVPADVPYITAAEIEIAISALDGTPIVLARASRDGGTNLLGLAPMDVIAPSFGPGSFAKHLLAARSAGAEPMILPVTGLARDIDLPSDLAPFDDGGKAVRTRRFLAGRIRTDAGSAMERLSNG